MEEITWALLVIFLSTLVLRITLIYRRAKYWEERGVAYPKLANFFMAGIFAVFTNVPFYEAMKKCYNLYISHKFVVLKDSPNAVLLARDSEFANKIMTKDFQYFVDHDKSKVDDESLLGMGLFSLAGNEWRAFRTKISPTFTTGKLKSMFHELEPSVEVLIKNIDKSSGTPDYDCKDDIMSYAMDVSASVIFGIELKNEELRAKYKRTATEILSASTIRKMRFMILDRLPSVGKFLGMKRYDPVKDGFFKNIIKQTFEQRKANNIMKNDYVQLLLNLKEFGKLEVKVKDPDDDYLSTENLQVENVEVTDDILTAQAFQFLTGGFEPISTTMLMFLIEVAQNEEIQVNLRKEIEEVKGKNGGYNYKSVREMVYLEQCIHETLRKYPVVPFLIRYCVKDYAVSDVFTIERGTKIFISSLGFHYDSAYFTDPEKFDPDRFKLNDPFKNTAYLPFGAGPRICIGVRFAMMEIKLALANIIENFTIKLGNKAKIPVEFSKTSFLLNARNGYLNMTRINNK